MSDDEQRSEAVFVISVAAELTGVHPQTLRIYERRGLLEPYRTPGGTRRYSRADLERLELIQALTEAGLNLEGVKRVMKLEEEIEHLRRDVAEMSRKVEEMAEEAERKVREVHRSYRREIVLHSRSQSRAQRDD
jgi:MerR family transcriptional regulator, heat shock protein HspR